MRILLGISGGIAAYKTPEVVRLCRKAGHEVRCILTDNGARLVAEETLFTLSGYPVLRSLWPQDGTIPHIEAVRWCDALLVAPATAHCLARFALGLADDLLSTAYLAIEPHKPVFLAPAMNTVMWQKAIVQQHCLNLRQAGCHFIDPVEGSLACGEDGVGAMADPTVIVARLSQG